MKLKPGDGATGDEFGTSVAVHGDYAIVGAAVVDAITSGLIAAGVPENNIIIYDALRTQSWKQRIINAGYKYNAGDVGVRCIETNEKGWGYDWANAVTILGRKMALSSVVTRCDHLINVPAGGMVAFVGAPWTRPPMPAAPPAQRDSAWAFVVSGSVIDGEEIRASDGNYTVTVKNLRTGETFTEMADSTGYFAAASADLTRKAIVKAGGKLEVSVVDSNGELASGPFVHEVTLEGIRDAVLDVRLRLGHIIPEKSALLQNYPNPFNPETWIPFHLKNDASVSVRIYSISGQLIRVLDLGHRDAGIYVSRSKAAYWDGKNGAGEEVASGIYFCSITAGDLSATRKMTVRK